MSKPNDLKTMGLKATLPRLRILSLFENTVIQHLSAEDVYRSLISEGEDIGCLLYTSDAADDYFWV